MASGRYESILLKLSGEVLAGDQGFGIDAGVCRFICKELFEVHKTGTRIGIVIGGGNFFRGMSTAAEGMHRTCADTIGMLATVMNSLALKEFFVEAGLPAAVYAANAIDKAVSPFVSAEARAAMQQGTIVIIAGGTGNPYFTTDTAAALRCAELDADVLLKATKVDGVYSSDPLSDSSAVKYENLTYQDALSQNLRVMDATAFSFCMENAIPIVVFKLMEAGNLARVVQQEKIGSRISKGATS